MHIIRAGESKMLSIRKFSRFRSVGNRKQNNHMSGDRVQKLFVNFLALLFICCLSVSAKADLSWEVRKISGSAWLLQSNQEKIQLQKNSTLQPGNTLKTGDRSRVLLARGKERIQVGSNTVLSIPADNDQKPGHTTIKLKSGQLDLIVEKMPNTHFNVDTPFIAAVVKGTRFTVSTTATRSLVRVFEGVVGVKSYISDENADIRPGKSASLTFSSQSQTRLLLLDNPPQARLFEDFPEVFSELNIPYPDVSNVPVNKDVTVGGIVEETINLVLSTFGAALSSIGNTLSAIFTPILMPVLDIIDQFYDSVLPNTAPLLLTLSAIVGLILFGLIAYSVRKGRQ